MKFKNLLLVLALLPFVSCNSSSGDANDTGWKNLFNGKNLDGWHQLNGHAKYTVENGEIIGTTVPNTPNSFLVTDKEYGDFFLDVDLKVDTAMARVLYFAKCFYQRGEINDPSAGFYSFSILFRFCNIFYV
ncbi:MAG: DUF1080 domain-containing protein [Bacteroidota bacterium]|nr:DUF1080 domain-containing protein [Bacteroidota bacterium]